MFNLRVCAGLAFIVAAVNEDVHYSGSNFCDPTALIGSMMCYFLASRLLDEDYIACGISCIGGLVRLSGNEAVGMPMQLFAGIGPFAWKLITARPQENEAAAEL